MRFSDAAVAGIRRRPLCHLRYRFPETQERRQHNPYPNHMRAFLLLQLLNFRSKKRPLRGLNPVPGCFEISLFTAILSVENLFYARLLFNVLSVTPITVGQSDSE